MNGSAPTVEPDALIQLAGITKTYGRGQAEFQALRGVDLSIRQGEFVAIMGPSGSGKSTSMNILGCLDTPTAGAYIFDGLHVENLSRDQRALLRRNYLGFVFQGFNLLARTSALENVELPLLYRGESAEARHRMGMEALRSVGLAEWRTTPPPNSPAVSSSASPSRAPSSPIPKCCWPMSRPATSIPNAATRSWSCWSA